MERVVLGEGIDFSRIVYGMWRIKDDADTSPAHVQAKIEACLDQGITTFDQADIYGDYGAEEVLGQALKAAPGMRDQMQIVTKCDIVAPIGRYSDKRVKYYDTSAAHIQSSVDKSLAAMAIETIDLLLVHRPDPFMDADETGAALDGLVASGKVRSIGVSNFRPWDWELLQSRMTSPLLTNQIEFSLGALECLTNGDLAFLQQHRIKPMAWSPLGGGALMGQGDALGKTMDRIAADHGTDRAGLAVAWIMAHPAGFLPVMGTNNLDRIRALGAAADIKLDRETWFELLEAANGCEVP